MGKFILPVLFIILVLTIFHSWFTPGLLLTFDFPFYSKIMMKDASLQLYAWDWHPGFDGLAGFFPPYSWVFPLIYIPQVIIGNILGFDWAFIERVVYLYPLLILMIFSPIFFFKTIFPENKFYLISVLVFTFNTYALLLAGGEIFVALAYSLIPFIFALVIKILNTKNLLLSIFTGVVLAIQIMLDPRITYVTMAIILIYFLFNIKYKFSKSNIHNTYYIILTTIAIPLGIAALLHVFWVIPTVLYGQNPVSALGSSYSTTEAVKYLSFAKFEQTISLLHPNWPDNIFGMTYFMRWEFLFLPTLAYSSLLFISRKQKADSRLEDFRLDDLKTISLFVLLGLIGAFLSKGANEPFGEIYLWMFSHIPGFIMFRDPAKWYPLVAISYAILIPFTTAKIFELLSKVKEFSIFNFQFSFKSKIFNLQNIFLLSVICYLLFLINPALSGQLGGMFKTTSVPDDYIKLEKFLYDQPEYFRTLWFPSKQRFGFYSNTHPEMSARILFNTFDEGELYKYISDRGVERLLQEASIKYVIVPFDSEKEIFLTDRKYDNRKYLETINILQKIPWLKEVPAFGRIAVFEVQNPKDHFYLIDNSQIKYSKLQNESVIRNPQSINKVTYKYITPVKYIVNVENAKKGDVLVFSEAFDSKWSARLSGQGSSDTLFPMPYLPSKDRSVIRARLSAPLAEIVQKGERQDLEGPLYPNLSLNSFILPENGSYSLDIYYQPQKWVDLGTKISLITFFLTILVLMVLSGRGKIKIFKSNIPAKLASR